MKELDELIRKFWTGQTTNAEDIRLQKLLAEDDEVLIDVPEVQDLALNSERKNELLDKLHNRMQVGESRKAVVRTFLPRKIHYWVAAASVLLILTGVFAIYQTKSTPDHVVSKLSKTNNNELMQVVNSTDSVQHIALADGSVVKLFPRSGISYYKSFSADKRDISLHGMAEFKVAKDSIRPFSVYSGTLTTTALGTTFTVDAPVSSKYIKVRLIEGKVVLRAAGMKAVYLHPGEECEFAKESASVTLKQFEKVKTPIIALKESQMVTTASRQETFKFMQKPLSNVFDEIGRYYSVKIESADPQINAVSFSGSFFETDSLKAVLKIICDANNLKFKEQQDKIIIEKATK